MRKLVGCAALKRGTADDGTPRATFPTLESIRMTLPEHLRPESCSTVSRDLNVQGIWRLSTVASPLLGPAWHWDRTTRPHYSVQPISPLLALYYTPPPRVSPLLCSPFYSNFVLFR
jgi:hypothetical protein